MVKGSGVNVTGSLTTSAGGDDFTILTPLHLFAPGPETQAWPSMPSNPTAPHLNASKYLARTPHCDTHPVQTSC